MQGIYFAKLFSKGSGFSNQLFCVVNAIMLAKRDGKHTVALDSFSRNFDSDDDADRVTASDVLDLPLMNTYFEEAHGIKLLDRHDTHAFNSEELQSFKEMALSPAHRQCFYWINAISRTLFEEILAHVALNRVSPVAPLLPHLSETTNCLHLRMEDDAIQHWSKMNAIEAGKFAELLADKYIEAIQTHFDPRDEVLVVAGLSGDGGGGTLNPVMKFMYDRGYRVVLIQKERSQGREMCAMADYVAARRCKNVFIGNFNTEKLNGSTFSYLIWKGASFKKVVMIDLDRITDPVAVTRYPALHFVVGTCLRLQIACDLLCNNLKSIQRFHPEARISVCVDNSLPHMVAEARAQFPHPNIVWLDNPFAKSGELGLLYVASHMTHADEAAQANTIIFVIHDSTCMRRAISQQDVTFIADFKPLWNTQRTPALFHTDSPFPFVKDHILPAAKVRMTEIEYSNFQEKLWDIMKSCLCVTFGAMVAGTPEALLRIWESGMHLLPPSAVRTRTDRCRIERLVSVCAHIAGLRTDTALCGDIMAHERVHGFFGLKETCTSYPLFSDAEALPTQPPFYKLWLGR